MSDSLISQRAIGLCLALGVTALPAHVAAQSICPLVEVVFVMDTSGSMGDEAEALCDQISAVESRLEADGINATTHLWAITGNAFSGRFSCLTNSVRTELQQEVPGDNGACGANLGQAESWGPATAIVAERFPWTPGAVRVISPISDEGACNGNPCRDPGSDRDAANNAIALALSNNTFVSPIAGTGSNACVATLGQDMARETMGRHFFSAEPEFDLPEAVLDLVVEACEATSQTVSLAPPTTFNELGSTHTVTATATRVQAGQSVPLADREIVIEVTAGPNQGFSDDGISDADGDVVASYVGSGGPGVDEISATILNNIGTQIRDTALKFWDADCNANEQADTCDINCEGFGGRCAALSACGLSADANVDGEPDECANGQPPREACFVNEDDQIDSNDVRAVLAARGQLALNGDPRDPDRNGLITANDARNCVARCTNARCAP